ncbi:MAG: 50S ribosomal protein L11 methyltransferase [Bacteroidota bacterium]|nr:50S ribosomal protein L11 methyltransferase [Bacteroidota bacterium]
MDYIQVVFSIGQEADWKIELFKDSLLQVGFDSFVDMENGFEAYAPQKDFKEELITSIINTSSLSYKDKVKYSIDLIKDQNWNTVWEESSPSVRFDNRCLIRKSNQAKENTLYDIIINPKQSFGTATHPTTYMIIDLLLSMEISSKSVMDMGCGTGVLGILAKKMGASYVESIDIDSWAYQNTMENALSNDVSICIKQGGAESINKDKKFDIFIANINLNILKENIPIYNKHINNKGFLILSGFYSQDVKEMTDFTLPFGYQVIRQEEKDSWALLLMQKIE